MVLSVVYKDNAFSIILLMGILFYMIHRKYKSMLILSYIVGLTMLIQYGLALVNLTANSEPMQFPYPFRDYCSDPNDPGRYFIPLYRKFEFLKNSLEWSLYFGMGVSNTILNGLWIDFFVVVLQQTYFYYFNWYLYT